jgi:hypothetical protein
VFTLLFLRELRDKQQLSDVTFLVDDAHHLEDAPRRFVLEYVLDPTTADREPVATSFRRLVESMPQLTRGFDPTHRPNRLFRFW